LAAALRLDYDILRLKALRASGHLELELIAFIERFVSLAGLDSRMMHENILPGRAGYKAVAFIAVKPLYCSLFFHYLTYLSSFAPEGAICLVSQCSRSTCGHSGRKQKRLHSQSRVAAASQLVLKLDWTWKNIKAFDTDIQDALLGIRPGSALFCAYVMTIVAA
jgi:hypothetical protein